MSALLQGTNQGWLKLIRGWLASIVLMLATGGLVHAEPVDALDTSLDQLSLQKPAICKNQRYALCAGSSCFVFNDVANCTCDIKRGDSISSRFRYDTRKDICSLNAEGVDNGFMLSTFSLPKGLEKHAKHADRKAIYKCPLTSRASYAKCDGAICFTSTIGKSSPGFNNQLDEKQIVCSCPVERAKPRKGVQIIGPYPCQRAFFENCEREFANNATGGTLYDGSPLGSTEEAIKALYGSVPKLNICE